MTIDEAIEALKQAKKEGHKAAVFAWWFADMFDRVDDDQWLADTEYVEAQMDWSADHDVIQDLINENEEDDE